MAKRLRVTLEVGPKNKRVVAVAPDWPGLERGAKTGEAALETLQSYIPRYAKVAKMARMHAEFAAGNSGTRVVEAVDENLAGEELFAFVDGEGDADARQAILTRGRGDVGDIHDGG